MFTVLSDDQVKGLLQNLTVDQLDDFRSTLSSALHDFSTNPSSELAYQQPRQTTTFNPISKVTSLYTPCSGPEGSSCKVVSLKNTNSSNDSQKHDEEVSTHPTGLINLFDPEGSPLALLPASTLTSFRTALASACLLHRRSRLRTLLVFGAGHQAYWHIRLALKLRGRDIRRIHVVNRRFSSRATAMLRELNLTPADIRQAEGWESVEFSMLTPAFHDFERLLTENLLEADVVYCCTASREDVFPGEVLTSHEGRRKGRLVVAVGSSTPEMRELPQELLLQATKHHHSHGGKPHRHFHKHADEGGVIVVDTLEGALKEAGEIIAAGIGPKQLIELGELVMLHRLKVEESETDSVNSQTTTTTATTLDSDKPDDTSERTPSIASAFSGSKETTSSPRSQSPKSPFHLPFHTGRKGSKSDQEKGPKKKDKAQEQHEDHLCRWLRDGTVVYKSVGLGLMDLVVGRHIVELAREKKIGTQMPDLY